MNPLSSVHVNARLILRWLLITLPIAAAVGSVVALFLWLLDLATVTRGGQPWLLYLFPFTGLLIVFSYRAAGKNAEAGNNLILDEIHEPAAGVPGRMAPVALLGTVATHLFGGSAGREGTAVQIGGALSEKFCGWFRLCEDDRRLMLTAGIAAGFGACFGTPLACTIMGVELFGADHLVYFAITCFLAYAFSNHTGIYGSQRIAVPKPGQVSRHLALSQLRKLPSRFTARLKKWEG